MNIFDVAKNLAELVPDDKVRQVLFDYLCEECEVIGGVIHVDMNTRIFKVPLDSEVTVVARVLQDDIHPIGCGLRIVVAVGGVINSNNGIVKPGIFNAILRFNEELTMYSADMDYF